MKIKCNNSTSSILKLDEVFPINSIYISMNSTDPAQLLGGGGTWTRIAQGRTLVGLDENDSDFNRAGMAGGEKTHQLTIDEMPSHHHFIGGYSNDNGTRYYYMLRSSNTSYGSKNTNDTGGDQAHNNLQPYLVTYIWQRTA